MQSFDFSVDTIALKKLMLDTGINTTLELAKKTGIDRAILGATLSGNNRPSSRTMYALVNVLNIPPEDAGKIFFTRNLHNQ